MKTAKQIADETLQHIQAACGDVAHEAVQPGSAWEYKIPKCEDPAGALADNLYNDVDFLHDTIGDYVFDKVNGDRVKMAEVYEELSKGGHAALKKAIKALSED